MWTLLKILHIIHLGKEYDQNINEGLLISLDQKTFLNSLSVIYKYIRIYILDENYQVVSFESERSLEGCIFFTSHYDSTLRFVLFIGKHPLHQ